MIVEIKNSKEKQAISRKVLEALTDWFGIEESRWHQVKIKLCARNQI